MPTSSLQFHCDPGELTTGLLRDWLPDIEPFIVIERADGRHEVHLDQFSGCSIEGASLVLGIRPFQGQDLPWVRFLRANSDLLFVHVGQIADGQLRETLMSGGSEDPVIAQLWRATVRRARGSMHRGATLLNHAGRFPMPSHRYTQGALDLANDGVQMLAVAGGSIYEFDLASPDLDLA